MATPAPRVTGRSLTVSLAGKSLALDADKVLEIIRLPVVTRVPYSPRALLGVANLRGSVLPIVSLHRMLHADDEPIGPHSRVVVYDHAAPVGLVVDAVSQLGEAGAGAIRLHLGALLAEAFAQTARPRPATVHHGLTSPINEPTVQSPQRALLCFTIAGQRFALPLESTERVLALPDATTLMPQAEPHVLGLVNLGSATLPLLSLAGLLGLRESGDRGSRRIVVIAWDGAQVGLVVEALDAVRRLPETAIDPVPPLLRHGTGSAEIESIGRLDGGALVSILSRDKLFGNRIVADAVAQAGTGAMRVAPSSQAATADQFLIFALGADTYGLPIAAVDEVVSVPNQVSRLPNAPAFISGIFYLRGRAVPLIDQRQRFATPGNANAERPRVVVVTIGPLQAGFVVDSVSEVLPIASDAIAPTPDFSTDGMRVFAGVAHAPDGRTILLIDAQELLSRAELDLVTKLAPSIAPALAP